MFFKGENDRKNSLHATPYAQSGSRNTHSSPQPWSDDEAIPKLVLNLGLGCSSSGPHIHGVRHFSPNCGRLLHFMILFLTCRIRAVPRPFSSSSLRMDQSPPGGAEGAAVVGTSLFIVNSSRGTINAEARKAIRSHVMRGKNKGKQLRKPRSSTEPRKEVRNVEYSAWFLSSPRAVATELSLFGYREDMKPYMLNLVYQGAHLLFSAFLQLIYSPLYQLSRSSNPQCIPPKWLWSTAQSSRCSATQTFRKIQPCYTHSSSLHRLS